MQYAHVIGGQVAAYPYDIGMLRDDHPNTSFPADPALSILSEFGVVGVASNAKPPAQAGSVVEEGQPALINGIWQQTWVSRLMTAAEIKATVPLSVTPLQIRKALRQIGIKAQVDQYLATLAEDVVEEWEYATEVLRDNPTLLTASAALGMTEAQADDLFRLAATK
ncbi:hypothetical protein [Aquisediminimonas sediminicola]|uniref:hypothetical protein n=1 Tax=Alteraquisediminimonas sediminicola TaxID=2676787 RepID=UPI001C8E40FD|nr:hypothetical protein [Aquisediminimonas sediminicola]